MNITHKLLALVWTLALAILVCGSGCSAGASGRFLAVESEQQFDQKVLEDDRPVLVEFYRNGCVRCVMLAGTLSGLSKEYGDRVGFYKVERTGGTLLRYRYGVGSYPTVILFLNGEPKANWVNEGSKAAYREGLDAALKAAWQGSELPAQPSAYSAALREPAQATDEQCCAEEDSGPVCINPPNALTEY